MARCRTGVHAKLQLLMFLTLFLQIPTAICTRPQLTIKVHNPKDCTTGQIDAECRVRGRFSEGQWSFSWTYNRGSYVTSNVGQAYSSSNHSTMKIWNAMIVSTEGKYVELRCIAQYHPFLLTYTVWIPICSEYDDYERVGLPVWNNLTIYPPKMDTVYSLGKCSLSPVRVICRVPGETGPWIFKWLHGCDELVEAPSWDYLDKDDDTSELTVQFASSTGPDDRVCLECIVRLGNFTNRVFKSILPCPPPSLPVHHLFAYTRKIPRTYVVLEKSVSDNHNISKIKGNVVNNKTEILMVRAHSSSKNITFGSANIDSISSICLRPQFAYKLTPLMTAAVLQNAFYTVF